MANVNPTEVQKFLKNANYPASRDDLVSHAREQGAPQDIIDELESISDKQYETPAEVMQEMGQMKTA